jgi:hypothetical protein
MSDQNFTNLLMTKARGNWTEDQLQAMDKKTLQKIVTYNGEATPLPEHLKEVIKACGWKESDRSLAMKVLSSNSSKSKLATRPEDHIKTNGGSMCFTPEKVQYISLNGVVLERANAAIPAKFGETEQRSNAQQCAAFCGQIIKNDQGKISPAINMATWNKVFPQGSLDLAALVTLANSFALIIGNDPVWKSLSSIDKNAMTGLEALSFYREVLCRISDDAYDMLNTHIVCDVLRPFVRNADGQWHEAVGRNGPNVPHTAYMRKKKISAACKKALQDEDYPGCFWYLGGYYPKPGVPEFDGTLTSVQLAMSRLRELQGPDTAPTALLASMRDYSGLTDSFGKRLQFLAASALFAWSQYRSVDIILYSVGDSVPLQCTLNKWKRYIEDHKVEGFYRIEGETASVKKPSCDFRLVLPSGDLTNVTSALRAYVLDQVRQDTVIVAYFDGSLPTSGLKGTTVDYDDKSQVILPSYFRGRDFVVYSPIYGAAFFGHDPRVVEVNKNKMTPINFWGTRTYVFSFSNGSLLRGVLTTFENFVHYGYGYEKTEDGGYDRRKGANLVPVRYKVFKTQVEWYRKVHQDIAVQMVSWLTPVSRYSPISNLPFVSKAGVVIALTDIQTDEGTLYANVARVATKTLIGRSIGWDDDSDEDDDDSYSSASPQTTGGGAPPIESNAPDGHASEGEDENPPAAADGDQMVDLDPSSL